MQTLAQELEKEGIKEGIDRKAKETAKKMLKRGFDLKTIIDITGLKKKEVETLLSKYAH